MASRILTNYTKSTYYRHKASVIQHILEVLRCHIDQTGLLVAVTKTRLITDLLPRGGKNRNTFLMHNRKGVDTGVDRSPPGFPRLPCLVGCPLGVFQVKANISWFVCTYNSIGFFETALKQVGPNYDFDCGKRHS